MFRSGCLSLSYGHSTVRADLQFLVVDRQFFTRFLGLWLIPPLPCSLLLTKKLHIHYKIVAYLQWKTAYSREKTAYPLTQLLNTRYWLKVKHMRRTHFLFGNPGTVYPRSVWVWTDWAAASSGSGSSSVTNASLWWRFTWRSKSPPDPLLKSAAYPAAWRSVCPTKLSKLVPYKGLRYFVNFNNMLRTTEVP